MPATAQAGLHQSGCAGGCQSAMHASFVLLMRLSSAIQPIQLNCSSWATRP